MTEKPEKQTEQRRIIRGIIYGILIFLIIVGVFHWNTYNDKQRSYEICVDGVYRVLSEQPDPNLPIGYIERGAIDGTILFREGCCDEHGGIWDSKFEICRWYGN